MNLFGGNDDVDQGYDEANQAIQAGYNNASNLMNPYTQNAGTDFNNARGYVYDEMGNVLSYGNPASNMWSEISEDPSTLYDSDMSGYQMSDAAQNEMASEMMAANNTSASSGQLGGTNNIDQNMQTAQSITSKDQQQYFDNIQTERGNQMNYLGDYRSVLNNLTKQFGQIINKEYSGSTSLSNMGMQAAKVTSNNDIGEGKANAQYDQNLLSAAGNLTGAAIGGTASMMSGSNSWKNPDTGRYY